MKREREPTDPELFFNLSEPVMDVARMMEAATGDVLMLTMNCDLEFVWEHFPVLREPERKVFISCIEEHESAPPNWTVRSARNQCGAYGVPHGKLFIWAEGDVLRVIITSANLVRTDYEKRMNTFWTQTFQKRADEAAGSSPPRIRYTQARNDFGDVLLDYLLRIQVPPALVERLQGYAFEGATVALVSSVPGHHIKAEQASYGLLRLKRLLDIEGVRGQGPLFAQVTSIGSLSSDYVHFVTSSVQAEALHLIWPTVQHVRSGLNGYEDGTHICLSRQNLIRAERWIRCRYESPHHISPHMKSFFRFAAAEEKSTALQFLLLGSHNLSKSAWGVKHPTHVQIQSFELSVLFLPRRNGELSLERFQIPFSFPPYDEAATPWCWDDDHDEPDRLGRTFRGNPRQVV